MIIKNLFLLINIFILLVFQALFQNGVNVTLSMPEKVNPGTDFVVEVTISKPDITGFAKYTQELPDGFTASVIDAAGGNFSFSEKNIKIIWMSLPTDKEFKIKYKITVGSTVNGTFPLSAKLSYLENNEKKTFDTPSFSLTVGDGEKTEPAPLADQNIQTTPEPANQNQAATNQISSDETNRTAPTQTGSVTANRNAPTTASGEFTVEITVNKAGVSGFAKIEEIIPSGFTATGLETSGSVFSFVDGKAKFLWMNLPDGEELKVSYKIIPPSGFSGNCQLDGTFSYVENEETKKAIIATTTTQVGASQSASQPVAQNQTQESNQTATQQPTQPSTTTPQKTTPAPITKVSPSAGNGVIFRVQICAVHKNVPNNYFNDLFKIQDEIYSETHEGWYKYTTGNYTQYVQARDRRVELANNGVNTGPFVTSYNNGIRITVQEALMITKQKWVQ